MYESDITGFLRELKEKRPHLTAQQRQARAIWWDHPQDPEIRSRHEESRIRQPAYVYQTGSGV